MTKVIGVDIVKEAVENAKKNAAANNVSNAEYHAGPAEQILPELLRRSFAPEGADGSSPNLVAIVDPPRAGLHHKAIKALRASPHIQRLVYVSCDAKQAYSRYGHCQVQSESQSFKEFLNQVSPVSLLMTALTALVNEGLFELTRRPSLTRAASLSFAEPTEEPGCSQVKKLKFDQI